MNIFISKRREYEFGVAFGVTDDWVDENKVWHIRFSFSKCSLVFAFRIKVRTNEHK